MSKETLDIDTAHAKLLERQNRLIQAYEGKIQTLLQERLDGVLEEEAYQEAKDDLRNQFIGEINETINEIDLSTPEIVFRDVMFNALLEQTKRFFGIYEAINKLKPKIQEYNNQIGDRVLDIDSKYIMSHITKLEKVRISQDLVAALNIKDEQASLIMNLIVRKEFGTKSSI